MNYLLVPSFLRIEHSNFRRRLSVPDAIAHPFFAGLQLVDTKSTEAVLTPVRPLDFEIEELDEKRIRELLLQEICRFHPEVQVPDATDCAESSGQ